MGLRGAFDTRGVVPAKAGTQYPRAPKVYNGSCGVLDARLRGHDAAFGPRSSCPLRAPLRGELVRQVRPSERCIACGHPGFRELRRVGRRIALVERGPGVGKNLLPLQERVVVLLLVVAPGADFLERLHRTLVDR